jgi:hypothetical protein
MLGAGRDNAVAERPGADRETVRISRRPTFNVSRAIVFLRVGAR